MLDNLILTFLICHSERGCHQQSEESELLFFDVKTPDSSLYSE
jgi:hypothetical protein